jgi:xanthine dehydrogenase YagR molybdenum-binding subunit
VVDTPAYDPSSSAKLAAATVIGKPLKRVDGILKVTGTARYAYEYSPASEVTYGVIVEAGIARGRIVDIDTELAERVPGVLLVMTYRNAPQQASFGPPAVPNRLVRPRPVLADDQVRYFGEPVALVVAESFETARNAAALVKVRYKRAVAELGLEQNLGASYKPDKVGPGLETDTTVGDFEAGFGASAVQIDAVYRNGYQNHNPMEPHAALAEWNGDHLTLYVSQQGVATAGKSIATTLQMPLEKVRLISRYVGGGFGSKLPVNAEVILAALAAKVIQQPVKVTLTRQQMFSNTGHRPAFQQHIRLGASVDGQLTSIAHEVWSQTARFDEFAEQAATFTRSLYAVPNRLTRHRLVPLDLQHGETMRAPGEAPGMLALESAIDELAAKLRIDPVELRIRNEPAVDPERQVPFSSRKLVECLRVGAERFGWERRPATPRSRSEGRLLIGWGMSAGIRPNKIGAASARVRLRPNGQITAQLDMTDIGNGSYTILTQVVSEILGVPVAAVTVELGDSRFPVTTGSGGSLGAGSSGSALFNACLALREKIAEAAIREPNSMLFGANSAEAQFRDGMITIGARAEGLARIAERASAAGIEAEGSVAPGETYQRYAQYSFAAYFVEVQVDRDTAEVRLRRMLGVFDAGRILNERTARSQLIGGMIWGVGAALHEEGIVDNRYGQFVNQDLAGYHVPVHADIPEIEAVLLDGNDVNSNPLGSKGAGELGICGSGAAVANAIYNATGVRVRSFPITLDKILERRPMTGPDFPVFLDRKLNFLRRSRQHSQ